MSGMAVDEDVVSMSSICVVSSKCGGSGVEGGLLVGCASDAELIGLDDCSAAVGRIGVEASDSTVPARDVL